MDIDMIKHIREGLLVELNKIKGEPRIINLRSEFVEELLFNTDEFGMKTFAFPIELMKKVDFTGISFEDFFAFGFDFTGFKGVAIDPQKVFDKDLSFANLNGVTIINTFDDVKYEGTNFEGMIYKTWEIRAKEYKKTMKK